MTPSRANVRSQSLADLADGFANIERIGASAAGKNGMLINFELKPLGEIIPWGKPDNLGLHWFGLTDGQYWMHAGCSTLLEYSEHARRAGTDRYCSYQIARILEDTTEMLPSILDPVPRDLVKYISAGSGRAWRQTSDTWLERNSEADDDGQVWELLDRAQLLLTGRVLDSSYLSPSASILMWSDETDVHIEWDNEDKLIEGELAWSAARGSFRLPRTTFVEEVRGFHARLFEQMTSRIEQVAAGALHPDIHVDLPGLIAENNQRRHEASQALEKRAQTCWDEIRAAILEISADPPSGTT